jgi:phage portal protein BeeE
VEDVARPFLMPLYKIGAAQMPALTNVQALNLEYYQQVLQPLIEGAETLMTEGLELKQGKQCVQFDTEGLLRMDGKTRAETTEIEVRSATLAPNEARQKENRPPKTGGDELYMQQQNYSLAALAKRDAKDDPFAKAGATAGATGAAQPGAGGAANDDQAASMAASVASLKRKLAVELEVAA